MEFVDLKDVTSDKAEEILSRWRVNYPRLAAYFDRVRSEIRQEQNDIARMEEEGAHGQ